MSIYTYTSEPRPPSQIPYHAETKVHAVEHQGDCPHHTGDRGCGVTIDERRKELTPECVPATCRLGYLIESHRGMVVSLRERNGYDDSDFYAKVWDRATGQVSEVCYASTRGWTYLNGAKEDLSPEDAAEYARQDEARRQAQAADRARREAEAAAAVPTVGSQVLVKSKRSKVPHGTEGRVFWFGRTASRTESRYNRDQRALASSLGLYTKSEEILRDLSDYRVGIETHDGQRVFCGAGCVQVLKPAEAAR